MKYDDSSWHYGGDFPEDLQDEAGATHIAFFATWAVLNGLAGEIHSVDFADDLGLLGRREVSPREWFLSVADGKLTDQDLNDRGNRFAAAYYGTDGELSTEEGSYIADYDSTFPDIESLYHVPDTWTSFDTLRPIIECRYQAWVDQP